MEYEGKLYGKVGKSYFPLLETTQDIEELRRKVADNPSAPSGKMPDRNIMATIARGIYPDMEDADDDADNYFCRIGFMRCYDYLATLPPSGEAEEVRELVKGIIDAFIAWNDGRMGFEYYMDIRELSEQKLIAKIVKQDRIIKSDLTGHCSDKIKITPPALPEGKWISVDERKKANFWSGAVQTGYCWNWSGSVNKDGYGTFRNGKDTILAHRLAYQLIYGEIDGSTHVLHKCDNPGCINPDHLLTGTHLDNMQDKKSKGRSRTMGRSSKFIGVGWRSDINKWRSYYIKDGQNIYIGCFEEEADAALAHDAKCRECGLTDDINFK